MDKLKQVLKYQFWILLGIGIILPLVGWFLASSGMAKGYEERATALNSAFGKLTASAADPNKDWEDNLKKVNTSQQLQVASAWLALWERQQGLKFWPDKLSTTDSTKFNDADRGYYRKNYETFRQQVWEQLKPVVVNEEDGSQKGLVQFPLESFPIAENLDSWRVTAPLPLEIEESQEDLWLLYSLIQAINYVNRNATSQLDAAIPQIDQLILRGGGGKGAGGGAAKSTSSDSGGGGSMSSMMASQMKDMMKGGGLSIGGAPGGGGMMMGMGGGAAGGDGSGIGTIPMVTFDPNDEFGEAGDETVGGEKSSSGQITGGITRKKRYVDSTREEWRTRGFYLEIKIEQTAVPELLVALANSEWPIRVTRVHQADVKEEELVSADAGMPLAGGAKAGGMAGGMAGMAGMPMSGMPGMGGGGAGAGGGMKAMSEMMGKKMAGGGAGGGGPAAAMAAMAGGGKAAGGGASGLLSGAASGLGGGAGIDGAGSETSPGVAKFDALSNPNLVTLALDGWFVIFNKPNEKTLALVAPPPSAMNTGSTPSTPAEAAGAPANNQATEAGEPASQETPQDTNATPASDTGAAPAQEADNPGEAPPENPPEPDPSVEPAADAATETPQ